jgi:hypothetical protein
LLTCSMTDEGLAHSGDHELLWSVHRFIHGLLDRPGAPICSTTGIATWKAGKGFIPSRHGRTTFFLLVVLLAHPQARCFT